MNIDWFTLGVEFGATFFGVLGAYFTTYYYDRRQKRISDFEKKSNTISALLLELDFNKTQLKNILDQYAGNQVFNEVMFFSTGSYEASLGSGDFALLSSLAQISIGSAYVQLKGLERTTEFSYLKNLDDNLTLTFEYFSGQIDYALKTIELAEKIINKEILELE